MPLRSDLLTKRWSTVELPILPFLAPRVFTPWPSFGRRAYAGAQPAQKHDTHEENHDVELSIPDEEGLRRQKRDFTLLRLAAKEPGRRRRRDVSQEPKADWKTWVEISKINGVGMDAAEDSKEASSGSSYDRFRSKYEEIWGTSKMDSYHWMNLEAESRRKKGKATVSGSGQFVRRIQQEVETIVGKREAKPHDGHDAVEFHKEAEQKAGESGHGLESHQEGERTKRVRRMKTVAEDFNWKSYTRPQSGFRRPLLTPKAPIKIVRWSPGQASDSVLSWQRRFAPLSLRLERAPKMIAFEAGLAHPNFYEGLMGLDSSISLRKAWEALPAEKRGVLWPELMLTALDEQPTKILKFLMATYIEPYPPGYVVSDSLDYVVSYYLGNRTVRNPKNALQIFRAFVRMLRLGPPGHIHLSQKSVHLLLKNLDDGFVRMLYQVLTESGHPLSKHTLMHFPSKVRLSGGPDERIDILQKLWEKGSDFNSPEVLSVCSSLLQRKDRFSEVGYSDSEIFEFILECGMKPNIIIYNILLQNSLQGCDPETAWQIHDMMVNNGIETDAYTYSLLLTDAKLRNDRISIKRILSIIGKKGMRNAHVATDVLHMIDLFRQHGEISPHRGESGRPPKLFERMLTVYHQYFCLEPLSHIIPWFGNVYPNIASSAMPNLPESTPPSNDSLMGPGVPTLIVMLTALLRECTEPAPVVQFYNHFCDLLKAGDPTATTLAQSTHVYNIILMALGRFYETLALCPRIIGDMLSPNATATSTNVDASPASAETQSLAQAQQRLHPKPDIYTWSILLKVFMDHGQPRAAEKVLSMMEERKVLPNQVTWNSLIVGYARMQDMSMTVDAVDRLKGSGFGLDGVTMKGLAYFQNRRALIEAMKASDARNADKSISKRPAATGKAIGALNKTIRIVQEGVEGDGLQREMEAVDDEEYGVASSAAHAEEEGDFVVGDIPREEDKEADSDG